MGASKADEAEDEGDGAEDDEDVGVCNQTAEDEGDSDRDVEGGDQSGRTATPAVTAGEAGRQLDLLL